MIENELGIRFRKRIKDASKGNGLEHPVIEDKNRLLKLNRAKVRIAELEDELKTRITKKEQRAIMGKNKRLQVKVTDLRYKVLLLESKLETLQNKLADGNK